MFSRQHLESRLDELQEQIRRAQVVTPDLMSKAVAAIRADVEMPNSANGAAEIDRLIGSQAWTDAALALIEHELPSWKLRRLVYEEGAWLCSLSRQWNLPIWLSDNAEARHESLPLAILAAVIEARRCGEPPFKRAATSVPQCRAQTGSVETICCDNFA
jgi:hypothetical protein